MAISLNKLIAEEKKLDLWNYSFLRLPIWPTLRGSAKAGHEITAKQPAFHSFDFWRLLKSFWLCGEFFCLKRKSAQKIICIATRQELADFANKIADYDVCFLNYESPRPFATLNMAKVIPADAFHLLRFGCRILAALFFFPPALKKCRELDLRKNFSINQPLLAILRAFGDCLYFRFLEKLFAGCEAEIFYAICIWPPQARLARHGLKLKQLQHGVISSNHVTYIGWPPCVGEELVLYDKKYEFLLRKYDYVGQLRVVSWTPERRNVHVEIRFPIVIFTQPLPLMQQKISDYLAHHQHGFYLRPHPRDHHPYPIATDRVLTGPIDYDTIGSAICYFSSVIEHFLPGRQERLFIFDSEDIPNEELKAILEQMLPGGHPPVPRFKSLSECVVAAGNLAARIHSITDEGVQA